jgi:hypothetical protein
MVCIPAENCGDGVEFEYLFAERSVHILDDLLHLLVIESVVGVDDGASEFGIQYLCVVVNFKDDRVAEFILIWTE